MTFAIATLTDTKSNGVHSVTIGKKSVELTTEAAMVASSAFAKLFMQSVPTMLAFEKAGHGNYRAAVEILALAAPAAAMKFLQPKDGVWKKGSVLTLAEKVIEREPTGKGYTKKQLVARSLATAIITKLAAKEEAIKAAAEAAKEALPAPAGE
jgi:hypothetical protein